MNHLTAIEIVDLLDGRIDPPRAAHLDDCAMCRAQADQLRATLERAALDVPEPSPLFWDHFSAKVRGRLATERVERTGFPGWLSAWPRTALATCAALVLLTLAGVTVWRPVNAPDAGEAVPSSSADALFVEDVMADEAWAEVRKAAERVGWDEANQAGITAPPGTAERAVGELSDRERRELISLLEAEMKRSGA
jgi:hypothetical protein